MSEQTNFTYRVPTDAEWRHVAASTGQVTTKGYNCRPLSGGFMGDAKTGAPNTWGVQNALGNAREFVTTAAGPAVAGGSYKDRIADCRLDNVKKHGGEPDEMTGIRLVREFGGGG